MYSKPDKFLGNNLKGFSLTTVAYLGCVVMLLQDMKAKRRIVWEEKLFAIVKLLISFLTFPQANSCRVTCSILKHL
jgi:hypothetical protein